MHVDFFGDCDDCYNYIHSDDLDGDYYDLVIEYPGYYEIDVNAGKVVN